MVFVKNVTARTVGKARNDNGVPTHAEHCLKNHGIVRLLPDVITSCACPSLTFVAAKPSEILE